MATCIASVQAEVTPEMTAFLNELVLSLSVTSVLTVSLPHKEQIWDIHVIMR